MGGPSSMERAVRRHRHRLLQAWPMLVGFTLIGAVVGAAAGALLVTRQADAFRATSVVYVEPLALAAEEDSRSAAPLIETELTLARRTSLMAEVRETFRGTRLGSVEVQRLDEASLSVSLTAPDASDAADATNLYVARLVDRRRQERIDTVLALIVELRARASELSAQISLLDGATGSDEEAQREDLVAARATVLRYAGQLAEAGSAISAANLVVVSPATAPSRPMPVDVWPMAAVGGGLGALLGCAVPALVLRRRRATAQAARLRLAVGGIPIIGTVSRSDDPTSVDPSTWGRVVAELDHRMSSVSGGSGIAIVSPCTPAVASLAAADLGAALVDRDGRVIVVDLDAPNLSLHGIAGAPRSGLVQVIDGDTSLPSATRRSRIGFDIVLAGAAAEDVSEALASPGSGAVFEALSTVYDITLVASPPLSDDPDANLPATLAGAALLVGQATTTGLRELEHAVAELTRMEISLLGVVVEDPPRDPQSARRGLLRALGRPRAARITATV